MRKYLRLPRLYPILDTETVARRGATVERVARAWLEGGAGILQFRHKGHWSRATFEEAGRVAQLCRESCAIFMVDDRADMAMLLEAGLHVGQDDLSPRDARKLMGPDAILGYSSHNAAQLCAAGGEPVSYVALGPIFITASKRNPDPLVGVEELRNCRASIDKPLVAIGGITRENVHSALEAGADSLAVIADLLPETSTSQALRERMEEWQQLVR